MANTTTGLTIEGSGNTLDTGAPFIPGSTTAKYDPSTQVLTVSNGKVYASATVIGDGTVFNPINDGRGYTEAVPVCFVSGTMIRTVLGDKAVETLRIGDAVVTASNLHRTIRWIGHRSYAGRFANRNANLLPIRFAAGSLGDNVPVRDLLVSPKHAMVLDGLLIPAEHLVNGTTITRVQRVDRLEYLHVELDRHDVLIAEGAASESYVEDNNCSFFHNATDHRRTGPGTLAGEAVYCLPRVEDGFALEAVRRRLAARRLRPACSRRLTGSRPNHRRKRYPRSRRERPTRSRTLKSESGGGSVRLLPLILLHNLRVSRFRPTICPTSCGPWACAGWIAPPDD